MLVKINPASSRQNAMQRRRQVSNILDFLGTKYVPNICTCGLTVVYTIDKYSVCFSILIIKYKFDIVDNIFSDN